MCVVGSAGPRRGSLSLPALLLSLAANRQARFLLFGFLSREGETMFLPCFRLLNAVPATPFPSGAGNAAGWLAGMLRRSHVPVEKDVCGCERKTATPQM